MAALFSPPAHAGTYSVTYSGGQFTLTNSSGNPTTLPYAPAGGQWGGSGTGYWNYGNGSAVAQGTITATFIWQSGGSGDNPPDAVIVKDYSSVSWNLSGADATNTCADGLGDPQVVNGSNGSSNGAGYQVVQSPGTSFSITCTPSVNVTGTGYPHYGSATIAVYFTAAAIPAQIVLSGTTNFNSASHVLIGQGVTASLSTGGYTQSNWQWTISGDPFAGFVTTATTGNAVELTAADMQQASLSYFYRSLSGGATSTVTCTATITFPNNTQQQITVSTTINVFVPTFKVPPTPGVTDVWYFPDNPNVPELEPYNDVTLYGMQFKGFVTTPSQFIGEEGFGIWALAQTVTAVETYIDTNNVTHNFKQNGQTGLDLLFPYANFKPAADGSDNTTGDTPYFNLTKNKIHVDDANTFKMYVLYQPPSANGASSVTWVPLQKTDWSWHGIAGFNATTQKWDKLPGSNGVTATTAATTTLPAWTQVITAGPF